jgi:hypothetical protein
LNLPILALKSMPIRLCVDFSFGFDWHRPKRPVFGPLELDSWQGYTRRVLT